MLPKCSSQELCIRQLVLLSWSLCLQRPPRPVQGSALGRQGRGLPLPVHFVCFESLVLLRASTWLRVPGWLLVVPGLSLIGCGQGQCRAAFSAQRGLLWGSQFRAKGSARLRSMSAGIDRGRWGRSSPSSGPDSSSLPVPCRQMVPTCSAPSDSEPCWQGGREAGAHPQAGACAESSMWCEPVGLALRSSPSVAYQLPVDLWGSCTG